MSRKYQHTKELLPQIKEMLAAGMTQKEAEDALGLTGSRPIHELLKRERRKELRGVAKQRGRKAAKTLQDYKYENKRLKMEVELLRDFLSLTGKELRPALNTMSFTDIVKSTASVKCAASSASPAAAITGT